MLMHGERFARLKITRIFKLGETTALSPSVRMSLRCALACARLYGRILHLQCQKALQLTAASATGQEIFSLVCPPIERCRQSGGASRDRTDDPLLAKQVLSQLSYGPESMRWWWAWVDSNYRPHAYQACALTN